MALVGRAGAASVTVKTIAGKPLTGELLSFSLEGGLSLLSTEDEEPVRVPADQVVRIATSFEPLKPRPESARLELAGGNVLIGHTADFTDDVITFETAALGTVSVPLERVVTWTHHHDRRPGAVPEDVPPSIAALESSDDVLVLTNGDRLTGFIAAIEPGGIVLDTQFGETRVPTESIHSARLVATEPESPHGVHARILTVDGQSLTVAAMEWSPSVLILTVFGGERLRVPPDRIARLEVLGGRWRWLTKLEPISYEHTPALGLPWSWSADRSVGGSALRVAGQVYEHGLGMHSQASITFDLKGEFREFVTSYGLDDTAGRYANVDIEIRIDGQLRHAETGLQAGRLVGPLRLETVNAKRIKLSVLFGQNADIQDRLNWIEAALIR